MITQTLQVMNQTIVLDKYLPKVTQLVSIETQIIHTPSHCTLLPPDEDKQSSNGKDDAWPVSLRASR